MTGDYTRLTFDATKAYRGVLKQQGRVSLDSDFNEFEEILDRRGRAEMYDTVGRAVVPITTPHGFQIGTVGNHLTIGLGRAYIDGLLAENFGDVSDPTKTVFDDRLGGVHGTHHLAYNHQPFHYPNQFPGLSTTPGTIDLVYLDVWQREVTVFEDAALRDPALGGPDTATRMQSAWQVKIWKNVAPSSCIVPPGNWSKHISASTGRMTATVTPTPPPSGPCVVENLGGYTGLENQFYRVEIHHAGTVGGLPADQAQFKWSRDNASLAASVQSIRVLSSTDSVITVNSTGHDAWLRFAKDEYVELLDDHVEFAMRESHVGGKLARITEINHATGEIHVAEDLTGLGTGPHPRIKRWDRVLPAGPVLVGTNAGTAIPLENGISVTFGSDPGDYLHAGDYWVFAARTADGTIERVVDAPPRGVLHHFAELALVTIGAPPQDHPVTVTNDCRIFWPPATCCTIVVRPGENIQHAIDSLRGKGGCVCLKMGTHEIEQTLRIDESNLTLHGEAPWVTVVMKGSTTIPMLEIGSSGADISNVHVEGIAFEAKAPNYSGAMLHAMRLGSGHIARCSFKMNGMAASSIGIKLENCRDHAIEHAALTGFSGGIIAIGSSGIGVIDNTLTGPTEIVTGPVLSAGLFGIQFGNVTDKPPSGIHVERNTLTDYNTGIAVGTDPNLIASPDAAPACRIAFNTIVRHGMAAPNPTQPHYAIACYATHAEIAENAANIASIGQSGVLVKSRNVVVARNEIVSTVIPTDLTGMNTPYGVNAAVLQGEDTVCIIRGNLFTGWQRVAASGADSSTPLGRGNRIDIVENRIEASPALFALAKQAAEAGDTSVLIGLTAPTCSILVLTASHARVAANEITGAVCAILVTGTLGATVTENRTYRCLLGIACELVVGCEVNDNIVEDGSVSNMSLGIVMLATLRCTVERNALNLYEIGIFSILSVANRIAGNRIYNGDSGIASLLDADLEIAGNTVEDTASLGIMSLFALHEINLAHNRTLRCGYRNLPQNAIATAIGIAPILTVGLAIVDSCHVIDTGESPVPLAPVFTKPRYGVAVIGYVGARVRNCNIASQPLRVSTTTSFIAGTNIPFTTAGLNQQSRALLMQPFDPGFLATLFAGDDTITAFSDATDNIITQSVKLLVEITSHAEVMFATNRCTNYARPAPPSPSQLWDGWSVKLTGTHLVVTGNRVQALVPSSPILTPSLLMQVYTALSAVGNMCSGGEAVSPPTIYMRPTPDSNFNATV